MEPNTALHTAARRYCQERFDYWTRRYEELQHHENSQVQKLFEPGWTYSEEAYRTFPRYRIDRAIRIEVERLTFNSGAPLGEMRASLLRACDVAKTQLESELKDLVARKALHEEGEDFRAYIEILQSNDLADIKPLPFRRVIAESESKHHWNQLKEAWGIDGRYWFPLKEGDAPQNLMAFHTDYWETMDGAALLRVALQSRGIRRVFQLHEFGDPNYEIDLEILEPGYLDGGERYSTSVPADWVVYASHESSITVCGDWLIQFFRKEWPGCEKLSYGGPYSTEDLRGTWDAKQ